MSYTRKTAGKRRTLERKIARQAKYALQGR